MEIVSILCGYISLATYFLFLFSVGISSHKDVGSLEGFRDFLYAFGKIALEELLK